MKSNVNLSLLVPVYNAEKFIIKNLKKLQKTAEKIEKNFEIIIVNDGSNDSTYKKLKQFKKNKKLKIFDRPQNFGKGSAIKYGGRKANGKYLIFIDCDLPYLASLPKIYIELKNKQDLVIATREKNLNKKKYYNLNFFVRRIFSSALSKIINTFIVNGFPDTQAGLKGFNSKFKNKILKYKTNKFLFDVEIIRIVNKSNLKLKKIYVKDFPNDYTAENLLDIKFYFFVLKDLMFILTLVLFKKI